MRLALAFAFFNPALWAARRFLELDREIACDDHVVREHSHRRDYALLLVRIARGRRPSAGLSMSSSSQQLAKRVESIMDDASEHDVRSFPGIAAVAAIFFVPWLLALTIHVAAAAPANAAPSDADSGSLEQAQYLTQMAPGATLHLYNYAGNVRVVETRGNTLSIEARAVAGSGGERPLMTFSGSTSAPVACGLARGRSKAHCDDSALGGPAVQTLDWTVSLPTGRSVSIHVGRGTVDVRGSGEVEVRDGQGDIDVAGGILDATTQRGNIVAKMSARSLPRSATLDAEHGSLSVAVPRALSAQIVATSLAGSIRSAIPLQFDKQPGSNELIGRAVLGNANDQQRLVLTAGSSIEIKQE